MKKAFLLVISIFLVIGAFAQHKLSVELLGGYGVGISPTQMDGLHNYSYLDSAKYKESVGNVYLGNGMNLSVSFNYCINKHFSTGLETNLLLGEKNFINYQYKDSLHKYTFYPQSFTILKPYFSFSEKYNKIIFSALAGPVVGLGKVVREYTRQVPGLVYIDKYEYYGGVALGMFADFETEYFFNPQISFVLHIGYNGLTYMPSHGRYTEAYKNTQKPVSVLEDMTVSERETDFYDDVTYTGQQDDDAPSKALKPYLNMDAFYFKIGVKMCLQDCTEKQETPARKL